MDQLIYAHMLDRHVDDSYRYKANLSIIMTIVFLQLRMLCKGILSLTYTEVVWRHLPV